MELCNSLKYNRSLYPGKAVFYYKDSTCDFIPLEAEVAYIRGKKSSFAEGYNADSTPKNSAPQDLSFSNPLAIEECYVPPNVEAIYCRFSLRVEANSLKPAVCNNSEALDLLQEFAAAFKGINGYKELALRYVKNLLIGTWLWRNQNSGDTEIIIKTSLNNVYKIENTRFLTWDSQWPAKDTEVLEDLSAEIEDALSNPNIFWAADITAKIKTNFCQQIFPSQPLLDVGEKGKLQKQLSKVKCTNGNSAVVFHSVKVGAAIQLIDDWWSDESAKCLRVHEYGADQDYWVALRPPASKIDFYSLLKRIPEFLKELELAKDQKNLQVTPQIYYLFAIFIKGGLFPKKGGK